MMIMRLLKNIGMLRDVFATTFSAISVKIITKATSDIMISLIICVLLAICTAIVDKFVF